jgi:hypothetical protein
MILIENKKDIIHDGVILCTIYPSGNIRTSDVNVYDNQCVATYSTASNNLTSILYYDIIR